MNGDECVQAMKDRTPVMARYANGEWRLSPHAMGRIIGYSDAPSVCIETADGERVWWRADLTVPAP